ncbi:MAG: polysaccharide pyruvyl transferase family protein [Verrucomicrobiales bacterium]|nr:polysaccharide pyruvyl transferase family protein [Verrucomicrobiales bacterium]
MNTVLLSRPVEPEKNFDVESNTGNLVYRSAVHKQIPHSEMFDWSEFNEIKNSKADLFVVPLANTFREGYELSDEFVDNWIKAIDGRPLIGIGMGTGGAEVGQIMNPSANVLRWTRSFSAIWTRGRITTEALSRFDIPSTPGTCPSLFETGKPPIYRGFNRIGVSNACGNMKSRKVEEFFIQRSCGTVFVQGNRETLDLYKDGKLTEIAQRTLAAGFDPARLKGFFDLEKWSRELKKHDLLIGPRFHCASLAFASGVPSVVIPIDVRTQELCQSFGMPALPWNDLDDFQKRISFDPDAFERNRRFLFRRYKAFLHTAGISVSTSSRFDR